MFDSTASPLDAALDPPISRRKPLVPFILLAATILVPTLFWYRNSFARRLDDDRLRAFLEASASPTDTQHALNELTRRLDEEKQGIKTGTDPRTFYPLVIALVDDADAEKRMAAAWAMQFDPTDDGFRRALLRLLDDRAPMVTWNAATSLARHGSEACRPVLLDMLRPFAVKAPKAGVFRPDVRLEETLGAGSGGRLGKIETPEGVLEVFSPVIGRVTKLAAKDAAVAENAELAVIAASQAAAMNALGALALPRIGKPEDAAVIEAFLQATPDLEAQVKSQAEATLAILRGGSESRR